MSHLSFEPGEPSREREVARSADDHISVERLAALADEQPGAVELEHLARCAPCAREREAHRSLLAMAESEREAIGMPLTRWEPLSDRLRAEGLLVGPGKRARSDGTPAVSPFAASRFPLQALRVAAALLFVAGGIAIGRATTGAPVLPDLSSGAGAGSGMVASGGAGSLPTTFASIDEATRWKNIYSEGYQRAIAFLAQNDSALRPVETPAVMRARLAALDRVSKIMQEAVNEAPHDPIINDFYLNSFGQREATLRQLNTVLPQNVRLSSF